MVDKAHLIKTFPHLENELIEEIYHAAVKQTFPANTALVKEDQYVKFLPIVLDGLVKVFTHYEEKELLLYYIKPDQSCIMSFSSCIHGEKSRIVALTERETTLLLIPADKMHHWINRYPSINRLFYSQYDLRYSELVEAIHHMLYYKLDKRLLDYLTEKVRLTGINPVRISHKEIANDLGTAREVVSRLVKKLEKQHLLKQHQEGIELLPHV